MKIANERKVIFENHPEFFNFIMEQFGQEEIPEGTEIELKITRPGEAAVSSEICVGEKDRKLFDGLKEMIRG